MDSAKYQHGVYMTVMGTDECTAEWDQFARVRGWLLVPELRGASPASVCEHLSLLGTGWAQSARSCDQLQTPAFERDRALGWPGPAEQTVRVGGGPALVAGRQGGETA